MKNAYLPPLLDMVNQNTVRAKKEFGGLSAAQLNWKPHPDTWSVGQCLHHIITTNTTYFAGFQAIADGTARQGFWAKYSPFSGFFGNMLLKGTGPEVNRKMKSPKPFQPTLGDVSAEIVAHFVAHQSALHALLSRLDRIDNATFKVPSPAAGFITYTLEAGVTIIVQHELRHLNQAGRLIAHSSFPKT